MKVVIINKSDGRGGAAIVSRRLMEALRAEGVEARMLVAEKLTDSPFVALAASKGEIKWKFIIERLRIFLANGFNRKTLFKIDTGQEGLPLWRHPWVKEADAVLLNWVNQGMLSLKGVAKILKTGKPVVWTMHDMWQTTGICHHAGRCDHFMNCCGDCPLLEKANSGDLSREIWGKKNKLYHRGKKITFVAVSNWLKNKAMESGLLREQKVEVIANAFDLKKDNEGKGNPTEVGEANKKKIRLLFGAARIDDPIKGLETLRALSHFLRKEYPIESGNIEIAFFGAVKEQRALDGFGLPVVYLGVLKGEKAVEDAYKNSEIVVSASSYETLPGTLVEAQAFGCIPVAFNQGGQSDIVEDGVTGFLAPYSENLEERAQNLALAILKAVAMTRQHGKWEEMRLRMKESVEEKFSYQTIARQYIKLLKDALK